MVTSFSAVNESITGDWFGGGGGVGGGSGEGVQALLRGNTVMTNKMINLDRLCVDSTFCLNCLMVNTLFILPFAPSPQFG